MSNKTIIVILTGMPPPTQDYDPNPDHNMDPNLDLMRKGKRSFSPSKLEEFFTSSKRQEKKYQ